MSILSGGDQPVAVPVVARPWDGGPVEFDRVVPPSGNMEVRGKQFWLGPARFGVTVTFWADTDVIHLLIGGARVKSVRSHLSVADLEILARDGGRRAGPSPLPPAVGGDVVEVDRTVDRTGRCRWAGMSSWRRHPGRAQGEYPGGGAHLVFFDPQTRELLRTRPNPLSPAEVARLRGPRPAGPPPELVDEPVRVQRRASNNGVIMVVGQKVALGRVHAGKTLTVAVSETHLAVECEDGVRTVRRTTTQAVTRIKAHRPRLTASDA